MKPGLGRAMIFAGLLFGLGPQPVMADRIDDVTRWAQQNFNTLSGEVRTLRQLLNHEQRRRDALESALRREQSNQEKRNIETFRELRQRLTDIERRLLHQEQVIKKLAARQ